MANLKGKEGELRAVLTIKRAATGKVETYELIGHSDPEQLRQSVETKEKDNGSNP